MKRLPWKYLAGLVDGEGCIDVQITRSVYVRPRLRITMTDPARDILVMCQNSYGGHLLCRKQNNQNWTNVISWELVGYHQACPVLRNIQNHLILKREQARFCLWLERNIKGQHVSTSVRDAVREELKLMKRDPHRLSETAQEHVQIHLPVLEML